MWCLSSLDVAGWIRSNEQVSRGGKPYLLKYCAVYKIGVDHRLRPENMSVRGRRSSGKHRLWFGRGKGTDIPDQILMHLHIGRRCKRLHLNVGGITSPFSNLTQLKVFHLLPSYLGEACAIPVCFPETELIYNDLI